MNIHWAGLGLGLLILTICSLLTWYLAERHTIRELWKQIVDQNKSLTGSFDLSMIEGLPEPARRYFSYTIEPGTLLSQTIELEMKGELCLGRRDKHSCRQFTAGQLLSSHGLIWNVRAGVMSGSDGFTADRSWTRFWLLGAIPLVRAGNNSDHYRSALGRVIAERAFWLPSSLLPGSNVRWEAIDESSARAIVTLNGLVQAVDITVADNGEPTMVIIDRWSNENLEREFRLQPFGGELSEFKTFDGYRLPTRVVGGNHFGTPDYFPFYRVNVTGVTFR